jgi:hypothetical protein
LADVVFSPKRLTKRLEKIVSEAPYDRIAKSTVKDIQQTARSGVSPATGRKFAKLKDSTIKNRKRLAKLNPTHPDYSTGKSNLTFTGQLINAIRSLVVRFGSEVRINIFVDASTRKPYRTGKKSRAKKTPRNDQLAKYLETEDGKRKARTLLGVTEKQQQKIVRIFDKYLKLELTKINKR